MPVAVMNSPVATLAVSELTVRSGHEYVIRGLSFNAVAGAPLWVVGENGAGKSTLMRALACREPADGVVAFSPRASHHTIAYYAPHMGLPFHITVGQWLTLHDRIGPTNDVVKASDSLLPSASPQSLVTKLSTGEGKRMLLWSLLRTQRDFFLLDEPYEHLSAGAKDRLTEIILALAVSSVVIVATNQSVPAIGQPRILEVG